MRGEQEGLRPHAEIVHAHYAACAHGGPDGLRGADDGTLQVLLEEFGVVRIGAGGSFSVPCEHVLEIGRSSVKSLLRDQCFALQIARKNRTPFECFLSHYLFISS